MKAFQVTFDTAGSSGFSEILLVEDEQDLETALEAKTPKKFKLNNPYSKINFKKEIPLSMVKIGDLSITEFLLLRDM